jgi:hypothetical protein
MKRTRLPDWRPTTVFSLLLLGASVAPLIAQSSTDQVWFQLQQQFTTAQKSGFLQFNYILGWLGGGMAPTVNWPVRLFGGRPFLIVGVCDNECTDVDLVLENQEGIELASDRASDDLPVIRITPDTTATYWLKPIMHACQVDHCGYGIGVFVQQ